MPEILVAASAWIEADPSSGRLRVAFRCQTCGRYVLPEPDGRLRPHWLKTVGRDKKKLPQHQCQDTAHYETADTQYTPYADRTTTITPTR